MEHFVIIVNRFQPLTIITKSSISDVAAVLDPPLVEKMDLKLDTTAQKMKFSFKDFFNKCD